MASTVWVVTFVEYANDGPSDVDVKTLHWTAALEDGGFSASIYGTQGISDAPINEPKVASQARAGVDWVTILHAEIDAEAAEYPRLSTVAEYEANLAANIAEQQNPTEGGFSPPVP